MKICGKHIDALISFNTEQCPVCTLSLYLWATSKQDFLRGIREGKLNSAKYPLYHHKRSVYDYPSRKQKRGKDGYLI